MCISVCKIKITFMTVLSALVLIGCGGGGGSSSNQSAPSQPNNAVEDSELTTIELRQMLENAKSTYNLPAVAAIVIKDGEVLVKSSIGVRSIDSPINVTNEDQWHIGSITKSMTATLAAFLVQEGMISWETTVVDVFPEFQDQILEKYKSISLDRLLSMTSGLEDDFEHPILSDIDYAADAVEVRKQYLSLIMSFDHAKEFNQFLYANSNYMIAGAMLEKVSGRRWQELISDYLFSQVGMSNSGFGPPGTEGQLDQPLGHLTETDTAAPLFLDNHEALDPAGRVHASLDDMAAYAKFHLQGLRGEGSWLTDELYAALYQSRSAENYGYGWLIDGGKVKHNGSNRLWYADLSLNKDLNSAVFVVTNIASNNTSFGIESLSNQIWKRVR